MKQFVLVGLGILALMSMLMFLLETNVEELTSSVSASSPNPILKQNDNSLDVKSPPHPPTENTEECKIPEHNNNLCINQTQTLQNEIELLREEKIEIERDLSVAQQEIQDLIEKDQLKEREYFRWPKRKGRSRVVIAGFPGSGVDAIRRILTKITKQPTFSVYTEQTDFVDETGINQEELSVWSNCWNLIDCHFTQDFPVIVKTFFPAIVMQSTVPQYDKILHVIRNPLDNLESFYRMCQNVPWLASRRRAWEYHLKKETSEYKKFYDYWRRIQQDSEVPMLTVRYEDLCLSMEHTVRQILMFLDLYYLLDEAELQRVLAEENCLEEEHIGRVLGEFKEDQAFQIEGDLEFIIEQHDYGKLMDKFNKLWR